MGKVRTRIIGLEDVEEKQKKKQREKSNEKKAKMKKEEVVEAQEIKEKKTVKTKTVKVKKRGKKYLQARAKLEKGKKYPLKNALETLKKITFAKFDESVELHLNVEKSGMRGEIKLPHSVGKKTRVVVVTDSVISDIQGGKIEFDILVAHPSYMPKLAPLAKVLGPRGLMPSPKSGTVSTSPEDVVKKFEGGLLKWGSELKFPLVHQQVGKISNDEKALSENIRMFISTVGKQNIQKAYLSTTMSPSIQIDIESI